MRKYYISMNESKILQFSERPSCTGLFYIVDSLIRRYLEAMSYFHKYSASKLGSKFYVA